MVLEDLGYLGSIIGNEEGEVWFMATANTPLNSLELNKIINKMAVWEETTEAPVDGKRNTKGTSRKISRKKAV